jgi:hypothetical protein
MMFPAAPETVHCHLTNLRWILISYMGEPISELRQSGAPSLATCFDKPADLRDFAAVRISPPFRMFGLTLVLFGEGPLSNDDPKKPPTLAR